jgi:hypothetical protein
MAEVLGERRVKPSPVKLLPDPVSRPRILSGGPPRDRGDHQSHAHQHD